MSVSIEQALDLFERTLLPAINAAGRLAEPYLEPADESDPNAFWIDGKPVKLQANAPAEIELHEGILKAASWITRSKFSQERMVDIATGFLMYACFAESWVQSESRKSTGELIKSAKKRNKANKRN